METALPGPEAVKEERDVEEVTQKLETESGEEFLAALPVFPVPFADQHNDPSPRVSTSTSRRSDEVL
jgi:hypothetical protein